MTDCSLFNENRSIENPFLLAPLAGITDSPFRRLCREQGAARVYSEMISAKGLFYNDRSTEYLLRFTPEEIPIYYQLFGSEPAIMAHAVRKLSDRGHAGYDINMGCPVPKVVKNEEGSALMKTPSLAGEIVRTMVSAEREAARAKERDPRPVTVKCRIGWDPKNINVLDFACRMEEAGAAAIAVHGRTRDQFYSGKADWEAIKRVKEKVGIPVIGSGDVFSGQDANRMLQETGCDYVMIARGVLGNPWIFRDALALFKGDPLPPPPSREEKIAAIRKQLTLAIEAKGEVPAVMEMRKHIGWYLKGIPGSAEMRRKVNGISSAAELRAFLDS